VSCALPPIPPLAVGLADAARVTGLSRRTIELLVHDGRLPSRRLGRRRLILYADLRRLLAADRPNLTAARAAEAQ